MYSDQYLYFTLKIVSCKAILSEIQDLDKNTIEFCAGNSRTSQYVPRTPKIRAEIDYAGIFHLKKEFPIKPGSHIKLNPVIRKNQNRFGRACGPADQGGPEQVPGSAEKNRRVLLTLITPVRVRYSHRGRIAGRGKGGLKKGPKGHRGVPEGPESRQSPAHLPKRPCPERTQQNKNFVAFTPWM